MSSIFTLRSSSAAANNWCTFMCADQVQDLMTFYIFKIKLYDLLVYIVG